MLRLAIGMAALGTVIVALAPAFWVLLIGRVLQGAIGAFLPLMFGIVDIRFPGQRTRRVIGYLCAMLMIGALAGTTIPGPLSTSGLGLPLWLAAAGLVIAFALYWILDRQPVEREPHARRMDWTGVILLGLGLLLLVLGIYRSGSWGYGSARTVGVIAAGLVVLAAWAVIELRVSQPFMDVRYLFRPRLAPIFVVGFLAYFAFLGAQLPNATYMLLPAGKIGYGLGLDATGVSLALTPPFLVMAITAALTARTSRRIGYPWAVALGCTLVALGALGFVTLHGGRVTFIVAYCVFGAGFGFIEGATRTVVVAGLRPEEISVGTGIYELSIGVGSAVGGAVAGAVLTANTAARHLIPSEHGYVVAWVILLIAAVLSVAVSIGYALYRVKAGSLTQEMAQDSQEPMPVG